MSKIEFWFAFGSTYSYLSVMRISDICAEHKIDIEWRPFLLTTIFRDLGMEQGPYLPFPPKLNGIVTGTGGQKRVGSLASIDAADVVCPTSISSVRDPALGLALPSVSH